MLAPPPHVLAEHTLSLAQASTPTGSATTTYSAQLCQNDTNLEGCPSSAPSSNAARRSTSTTTPGMGVMAQKTATRTPTPTTTLTPTATPTVGPTIPPPDTVGKIAFQSTRSGDTQIWTMNADGSNQVQLTADASNPTGSINENPSWSPYGTLITFEFNPDKTICAIGYNTILEMNANGSNVHSLTPASPLVCDANGNILTPGYYSYEPIWSPDGSQIAFVSNKATPGFLNYNLYVMNADGSNIHSPTSLSGIAEWPAWSPDGTKLAFAYDPTGTETNTDFVLEEINADGTGLQQLSTAPTGSSNPKWSPDGRLVFTIYSASGGSSQIDVMPADGSQAPSPLFTDSFNDNHPAWAANAVLFPTTPNLPQDKLTWHDPFAPSFAYCSIPGDTIEEAYLRHLDKIYRSYPPFTVPTKLNINNSRLAFSGSFVFVHTINIQGATPNPSWATFKFTNPQGPHIAILLTNNGIEYMLPLTKQSCQ